MQTTIIKEAGYEEALYGLSLSFKDRAIPPDEWWTESKFEKMKKTSLVLSPRDKGHNKFLESMMLWVDIEAPRYWWSEFDTYRVGVTKQSESTMHTLKKRDVTPDDFSMLPPSLNVINKLRTDASIDHLKGMLPESYLQRRLVCTNYRVLKNIIEQRHDHKLPEWRMFIESLFEQMQYPEYLNNPYDTD